MADLLPNRITKAPKAFAGLARKYNELLAAIKPISNITTGPGLSVSKSKESVLIVLRDN